MSEWVNYARDAASCSYLDGELRGVARKSGEAWLWFVEDYSSTHRGEPVETRDLARESCDSVVVAWVLVALAKRAAAWAEGIDARLAREYREAAAAATLADDTDDDAQSTRSLAEALAERRREREAMHALLRGWP